MKRLAIAMGLLASITTLPLPAQTVTLKANVPFDFRMGSVYMPAGEYTVHQSGSVIRLRGTQSKPISAMFLTQPTSAKARRTEGTLVFNRYGDDYFLSKVWTPNSANGRALPTSAREKELMSRAGFVQTASTALERK